MRLRTLNLNPPAVQGRLGLSPLSAELYSEKAAESRSAVMSTEQLVPGSRAEDAAARAPSLYHSWELHQSLRSEASEAWLDLGAKSALG